MKGQWRHVVEGNQLGPRIQQYYEYMLVYSNEVKLPAVAHVHIAAK